ncbi:MAG TPA: hypothetical protein DIC42_01645 [Holosporales bacterium]|nr:hypothetical protein [Holosporales bacterium]
MGLCFELSPIINSSIDWNAIIGIATFAGLATTWRLFIHSKREQQSLFYLNEIKSYYAKSVSLLKATDNNNVNWHQAIEYLKMAESLVSLLQEQAHQNICVMETMGTGFQIINIVKDIDDFRFFYGIANYKEKDSASLFQKSNPQFFETPMLRIAPKALYCLCAFIDKVNRIFNDLEHNTARHQIFKKDYFKTSIKNYKISALTEQISMNIVIEYIKNSKQHKIARTQRHLAEIK